MKYLLLLLLIPSVYLQAEWDDWHPENKQLYKNFVALNMIDVYQTNYYLNNYSTTTEMNPIFGDRPSTEKLIAMKVLGLYGTYLLLDGETRQKKRRTLKTVNYFYMGVVIHNGYIGIGLRKEF